MKIKKFTLGMYQENCYVVSCSDTKSAFVVDPGVYNPNMVNYIEENHLNIESIILTHAHGDHICGLMETAKKFNAPIYIHKSEASVLNDGKKNFSEEICGCKIEIEADRLLKDGKIIQIGKMEVKIIHTPGHTPGGICIHVGDVLISGDTLFEESIGRTDFKYSSTDALVNAIKEKLYLLPDHTRVYPGHGMDTTIGHEKKRNPFVKGQ